MSFERLAFSVITETLQSSDSLDLWESILLAVSQQYLSRRNRATLPIV